MASLPREGPLAALAVEGADLTGCPVRTRYLRQLLYYGSSNRRWRAAMKEGARGNGRPAADKLISSLLRAAAEGTTFYPEAFSAAGVGWRDFARREDLPSFPSLTRSRLQERHRDLFHRSVGGFHIDEGWLGKSSGSTGEPVRFFMDGASIHFFTAFVCFLWGWLKLGPLPRPGSAGIVLLCTLPRSEIYSTWMPLFRFTRFRKLHWEEPGAQRSLARLSPAVISGDPDSLSVLAEALEAGLPVRPRLVLSSAFPLPPETASRIEAATGAKVVDYYSMAETGPIAWRCARGIFHLLEGVVEAESVAGEILVTNLRNPFFPLIRYHTGDRGEIAPAGRCPCGAVTRTLHAFAGRVASRFIAAGGVRVDPSQLQPVLSRLEVKQFQLTQLSPAQTRLRYMGDRLLADGELAGLEEALGRLLGVHTRILAERESTPIFRSGEKPIVYRTFVQEA